MRSKLTFWGGLIAFAMILGGAPTAWSNDTPRGHSVQERRPPPDQASEVFEHNRSLRVARVSEME